MHTYGIVRLIHKIQLATVGKRMPRAEIRLKYHYHTCPVQIPADVFHRLYEFIYSRLLGFNRYTLILGQ